VHGSTIVDLAPGHSLVEALMREGPGRLFVTDWRSASAEMRYLTIDSYLADLNVTVDEIGSPVDLVGLCQGGWLALLYAARFPTKVRKLVLAGAPVDLAAAPSRITTAVAQLPLFFFEDLVRRGDGRVPGRRLLEFWPSPREEAEVTDALQLQACDYASKADLLRRFKEWDGFTVDLPGPFYHQVVLWLFKENRLAENRFTALGRQVDLGEVRHPLFLVAAKDDVVVPPPQMLAALELIGTKEEDVACAIEPGSHLSMFFGRDFLQSTWPRVARWLA
jgi:poly(3-hydroxyalkanoate) synthetase